MSNRSDEELRGRIIDVLELGELGWLEVSAQRNASASEAIRSSRFGFVPAATSVIDHRDEI